MQFPKVYVIIVWYNGAKWVQKNIESLLHSQLPVHIICIDNCSSDDTVALLQNYKDQITFIQAPSNLGFGKANNLGIDLAQQAQADFVFFLNQDTWIYPETISNLVQAAQQNLDFGIISPIHLGPNETDWDANFATYAQQQTGNANTNLIQVPFVNAAAWLIPAQALQKVSYFEPLYGHYGEDRNFTDRIAFHHFKIGICTQAFITHDRVLTRHFKKDCIQSEYKILSILLNPNLTVKQAKKMAFKNVLGLPKYFFKYYGALKSIQLFSILFIYYFKQLSRWSTLAKARNQY
ncbi:glycosyltransferase family 2 protein [Flavobacterium agricola]|uniref:Glycosyltransferase family 2 protein n=1 Tax=Flavobacterium agricola TaxID=2870839 RepID=A0ABY6M0Y4_9FLAO|nr:glycosyltransferase family 2 protein [Flavobacterium agricola]UYW01482.1 glycosyltransferase family 2 protein [Flavobacterium agricola]